MVPVWPTPYIINSYLHSNYSWYIISFQIYHIYQSTSLFEYSDDKQLTCVGMNINNANDWTTVSRLKY